MPSLYDLIMEHVENTGFINYERILPYYICSLGCHIGNLRNQLAAAFAPEKPNPHTWPFHYRKGLPTQLRLNLIFIAPSGWSKSFTMKQFMNRGHGLIAQTDIKSTFENNMNETYLCGGKPYRDEDNKFQYEHGLAQDQPFGLIGVDEFASITEKGDMGKDLLNALLGITDDGWVTKGLGGVKIEFQTYVTMWIATQNTRLDLSSGLHRRFFVIGFSPSKEDEGTYFDSVYDTEGQKPDVGRIKQINLKVEQLRKNFVPSDIELTPEYDRFRRKFRPNPEHSTTNQLTHSETLLFDNLAVGYNIMKYYQPGTKVLKIRIDSELKRIYELAVKMRKLYLHNPESVQVAKYIGDRTLTMSVLKRELQHNLQFSRELAIKTIKHMLEDFQLERLPMKSGKDAQGRRHPQEVRLSVNYRDVI